MELSSQTLFITVVVLGALVLALLGYVISLRRRFANIFRSETGKSFDGLITAHLAHTDQLEKEIKRQLEEIERLKEHFKRAFQRVEMLRYNSFDESGAPQSFTLVALDGRQNGFLLTHLQLKDTGRFYIKPIEHGQSHLALSKEEEQVLAKTLQL